MDLDQLRDDIIQSQKKGLPFIMTSVVIWFLIACVASLNISFNIKNIMVFICSCPLMPLARIIGKKLGVNIFAEDNELGQLGFLFTLNQVIYLLIVMWVLNAVPEKMIMVYAMVFGAHLLPYSWLYKSNAYKIFAIIIPIISLILGMIFNGFVVASVLCVLEIFLVLTLKNEMKAYEK